MANSFLSAQGRQVTGLASVDMHATGPVAEPIVNGFFRSAEAAFEMRCKVYGSITFRRALQPVEPIC